MLQPESQDTTSLCKELEFDPEKFTKDWQNQTFTLPHFGGIVYKRALLAAIPNSE